MHAHEGENRLLAYAVLASIALHGLLILAFPQLREALSRPSIAPPPIVARLVAPQPAAAPAPQVAEPPRPEVAAPPPAPPPPRSSRSAQPAPISKLAPPVKPAPISKPAPPAPEASLAAPAAPSAPPPPAAPAAPAAPGPVAIAEPQSAPTAARAEPADPATLEQYRLSIISSAKRYWKKPHIEGMGNVDEARAVVRMEIGANGMISALSIRTSAGHQLLDRAALETIRLAKPLVPIPQSLRGKEFAVEIPFIINLRERG